MGALNLFRFAMLVLVIVIATASCQKRGDFEVPCKIETLTDIEGNVATFHYNVWGDPVSITESNPVTGKPHYYFEYDNKKRLTGYTAKYADDNIESVTKYLYNSSNFVYQDTTFYVKDIHNPTGWLNIFVNNYTYDSRGRIIKVTSEVLGIGARFERDYAYDANGNLANGSTYSNKTNYLRTSLVLAFINRNYSVNSVSNATSYNTKKLPLTFDNTTNPVNSTLFMNMTVANIDYNCH